MRKAEAEGILAAELAAINGGPITRSSDGTIAFGEWIKNFYILCAGLSSNAAGFLLTLKPTR